MYRVDRTAILELVGMDGAEVSVVTGVPLSALRAFDEASDLAAEWAVFIDAARPSWALEDAQGPIPPDPSAVDRLPVGVTRAIMRGWRDAAVQPPAPLPPASSATGPSEPESPSS